MSLRSRCPLTNRSEKAVDSSDFQFSVDALDGPVSTIRVVPDDSAFEVQEVSLVSPGTSVTIADYGGLQDRCQRQGMCRMGFTIEVLDAAEPVDLMLIASEKTTCFRSSLTNLKKTR